MTDSTTYIWATMCEPLTIRKDTTELKPCPFCNAHGKDVYVDEFWERYDEPYFVTCHGCGARGPCANTKEKAIENWNRRVKE